VRAAARLLLTQKEVLPTLLSSILAASPWTSDSAAPTWRSGDERSWTSLSIVGVADDGRVALALERGWSNEGVDYSYVLQLVDPRGELPVEQVSYGTDDPERATLAAAWSARGDAFRTLLEIARVTRGHAGWTSDPNRRPSLLELSPDPLTDDYFDQISIEARVGGRLWFRTERSLIRTLSWAGVVRSKRGDLHVFLACDRGWEGVPGRWAMVQALPAGSSS
jgi:hypothetical protein